MKDEDVDKSMSNSYDEYNVKRVFGEEDSQLEDTDESEHSMFEDEEKDIIGSVKYINLKKRKQKQLRQRLRIERTQKEEKPKQEQESASSGSSHNKSLKRKRLRFKKPKSHASSITQQKNHSDDEKEENIKFSDESYKIASNSNTRQRRSKSSNYNNAKTPHSTVKGYSMVTENDHDKKRSNANSNYKANTHLEEQDVRIDPYKLSYEVFSKKSKEKEQAEIIIVDPREKQESAGSDNENETGYKRYLRWYEEDKHGKIHWPNFENSFECVNEDTAVEFFQSGVDMSKGEDELRQIKQIIRKERIRWHPDNMARWIRKNRRERKAVGDTDNDLMTMRRITAVFQIIDSLHN